MSMTNRTRWNVGTTALLGAVLVAQVGCAHQVVRFDQPRGVAVVTEQSHLGVVPFNVQLLANHDYRIFLPLPPRDLRALGFSDDELRLVAERGIVGIEGNLMIPATSNLPSVFRLEVQWVRAAVLEDSRVYWEWEDDQKQKILTFTGWATTVAPVAMPRRSDAAGGRGGVVPGGQSAGPSVVSPPSNPPTWLAWSASGAGAVVAAVFGVALLGTRGEMLDMYKGTAPWQELRASARGQAIGTGIGAGVAVAGAVAALLMGGGDEPAVAWRLAPMDEGGVVLAAWRW
jgi:hypothetical protein